MKYRGRRNYYRAHTAFGMLERKAEHKDIFTFKPLHLTRRLIKHLWDTTQKNHTVL
jgi:hypothetical protein